MQNPVYQFYKILCRLYYSPYTLILSIFCAPEYTRAQEILTSKIQNDCWASSSLYTAQTSSNMADISTTGRRHEEGNFKLEKKEVWGTTTTYTNKDTKKKN
jgi:hypothetical protein